MRILITGATGFIGGRLALAAAAAGHQPRGFSLVNGPLQAETARRLERAGMPLLIGSVDDAAELDAAVADIEVVIHLAAAQHEADQPDSFFRKVNVDGSLAVFRAARRAGVRRFVYGSTIGVYGQGAAATLDETSKPDPDNAYGRSKLEAESALLAEAAPPELVICRIGEAYGPGDGRLVKIFKAVKKGLPCRVGKGANLHQPIHVEDLNQGLLAAASRPGIAGERFLLPGPSVVDSRVMIDEIAAAMHKKPPPALPMLPFKLAAIAMEATMPKLGLKPPLHRRRLDFFTKNLVFDLQKSKQQLGFEPNIDYARGIRETCDWYRANGVV